MGNYTLRVHFANYIIKEKYEMLDRICPFEVDMLGWERIHPWMPHACQYIEDSTWTHKAL
jgi:hypothetical protein